MSGTSATRRSPAAVSLGTPILTGAATLSDRRDTARRVRRREAGAQRGRARRRGGGQGAPGGRARDAPPRRAVSARPGGASGNGLPASAVSACAVTHTGVCALVRE